MISRSLFRSMGCVAAFVVSASVLSAQTIQTGRVVGRVIDATSGQGITDAGVSIVGTTLGTHSGVDGRFQIAGIAAGTVTIQVRRIGYAPKEVTGLLLTAGQTLEQNVSMSAAAAQV